MGHLASGGGRSPGASLSVPVGGRAKALPWWRTPSVRRYLFGYTLLAPAVRGLVVIPFTIPIAISVLGWKWMFDSQFSVLNWALSGLGLIGEYGTPDWPVWLGQPMLALASVMFVNVWRSFPFSAIVLLAGMTSVSPEIIDAAKVDGATFMQRFRKIIVPMIAPILFVGAAFDTVFTLSDLSIVYLLTNGGPDGATG